MLEAPADRVERPAGHHRFMTSADRPRRTCLTVPGSSERFLAKARDLAADEVILDLEDSVAAGAKQQARGFVAAALDGGWPGQRLLAVRINGATSPWAYRDVIEVAERSGAWLDAIVLPKVSAPAHVIWLDLLLGPGRAGDRPGAGRHRHRGADRGRGRPGSRPGHRGRVRPAGGAGLRPGGLHGQRGDALAANRRPARRLRGRRCLPLRAAQYPRGGPVGRAPGDRRAVCRDRRHRRADRGIGECRGTWLRRQVGAASRPDRAG